MTDLQKEQFIIDLSARVPYRTLVKEVDPIRNSSAKINYKSLFL